MKCPVCSAPTSSTIRELYDDRYGYPGKFKLLRCHACGHMFVDHKFSPLELTCLYTNFYPRRTIDVAAFTPHQERSGLCAWMDGIDSAAFRWVPKNVRVLDIGCGFGEALAYHMARGCDAYGVEADENVRGVVDQFHLNVHIGLFDESIYAENFFDVVTMDQTIEHVSDPMATLKGIERILKPGGILILSTPNAKGWVARVAGDRWINWHTPYHLQFFSRGSMRMAAEKTGLALMRDATLTNSEWMYYQWIHLITRPRHGEPSGFWSPRKFALPVYQAIFLVLLSLLHRTKVNHFMTRLLDLTGAGDNFLFFLRKP